MDEDILDVLRDAMERGEVRVIVHHHEAMEIIPRNARSGNGFCDAKPKCKETADVPSEHVHKWEFDRANFKRRICVRAGCPVKSQVFQIQPESLTRVGIWIDEPRKKPVHELDDVYKFAPIVKRTRAELKRKGQKAKR